MNAIRRQPKEKAHPLANDVLEKLVDQPEQFAVPELFCFEVFFVLQQIHSNGLDAFQIGLIPCKPVYPVEPHRLIRSERISWLIEDHMPTGWPA